MTDASKSNRPKPEPLLDDLGKMIIEGREATTYLWHVPDDADTRNKITRLLEQIRDQSAKKGRKEMPSICEELLAALHDGPGPQPVDLLHDGFDRVYKLWKAAKSGLV